jgi:hypothetical protein
MCVCLCRSPTHAGGNALLGATSPLRAAGRLLPQSFGVPQQGHLRSSAPANSFLQNLQQQEAAAGGEEEDGAEAEDVSGCTVCTLTFLHLGSFSR